MKSLPPSCVLLLACAIMPPALRAQEQASYAKQVRPFLAKYCLECHNADKAKGELVLESLAAMKQGGKNGPVLVPGKPDESRLVVMVEGKGKPVMPPKTAKQAPAGEFAILRKWVAAGAKDDSVAGATALPKLAPRQPTPAPIAALAYQPDGKHLAAGGQGVALLLDVATQEVVAELPDQRGKVTSLAFNKDGSRLAVASGSAGSAGQVRIYDTSMAAPKLLHTLDPHKDLIHALAFSPDGKLLASTGYDRIIQLTDTATGKPVRSLKDHSDAVHALAFSPDGKLLASAAADRAVKVWDVATGTRLYTLGESTDWLYSLAWSPDGRHLVAGGVDKSIRVWLVNASPGKLVQSVFAHEGAVTRLAYSADGKTLYSLGEDRVVKVWDRERMVETRVLPAQPEAVLALAVRPDGKQIAVGRYDGAALLLDTATGKTLAQALPAKPKPPQLTKVTPNLGLRGRTVRVTLEGKHFGGATAITSSIPEAAARLLPGATATSATAEVSLHADAPAGNFKLGVKTPVGEASASFTVDVFAPGAEIEPNDTIARAQPVEAPLAIAGVLAKAGDVDFFRFFLRAGQQLGIQAVTGKVDSKLDPVLRIIDAKGRVLRESGDGTLGFVSPIPGDYVLSVHDREYRGGPDFTYRLQIGDIPIVTSVLPMGVRRGEEASVRVQGVNLSSWKESKVKAGAEAAVGSRIKLTPPKDVIAPLGTLSLVVGEFPEKLISGEGVSQARTLSNPGTGNGVLAVPGSADLWRFRAKQGEKLILEAQARRLGSPLDSYLEVLDGQGKPVTRAVLRSVAKTYTTFRDHDAASAGIRIETWSQLAINDFLYVNGELARIEALPKNPDDDCRFCSVGGQRVGFLDTTPTHHSLGEPMYKVSIHPPGTKFPPNGFPVIELPYLNDDGGPGYGKDSRIFFDPPANGEYQLRIGDARGQGGPDFVYRLTVRPPRPSFSVKFTPTAPAVWKGGAVPIAVTVDRVDGFEGPVEMHLENLPAGFSAPVLTLPAEENTTAFSLFADAKAVAPTTGPGLKLVAKARIDGKDVVQEATGGLPTLRTGGDLTTIAEQKELALRPGGEVSLTVGIERHNGFKGRVPLDVRGLPRGVRVLDIGLNGILITEQETKRTMVLYAEPWVQPMDLPIVVLSRQEGKNTEHAAAAVHLKIK